MTDIQKDALAGLLFGGKKKLLNLKLCRGDAPHVPAPELRQVTHFALAQVAMSDGMVDFPEDRSAKRMDLAALVSI